MGGASEASWLPSVSLVRTRVPDSARANSTPVMPTCASKHRRRKSASLFSLTFSSLGQMRNLCPRPQAFPVVSAEITRRCGRAQRVQLRFSIEHLLGFVPDPRLTLRGVQCQPVFEAHLRIFRRVQKEQQAAIQDPKGAGSLTSERLSSGQPLHDTPALDVLFPAFPCESS